MIGDTGVVIRHVVLFQFAEGTSPAAIDAYERSLTDYVAALDGVTSYVIGRDARLNPGTFDFSIVADFVDEAAFRAYFDDERHKQIQRDTADMIVSKSSSQSRH